MISISYLVRSVHHPVKAVGVSDILDKFSSNAMVGFLQTAWKPALPNRAATLPLIRCSDSVPSLSLHVSDFASGITPPSAIVSSAATSRTIFPSSGTRSSVTREVMPETEIAASGSLQSL